MLQIQQIRENTTEIKQRLNKRNPKFAAVVDEVLKLDEETRKIKPVSYTHLTLPTKA